MHAAPPLSAPRPPGDGQDADEPAFEAFAQAQDPVELAAATWVARRRDGLDAAGEAAWQAWLAADPRHGSAYDDLAALLGSLRQLPAGEVAALKAGLPTSASTPPHHTAPAQRPAAAGWRQWLAGLPRLVPQAALAASAIALVGGGWLGWGHWRSQPLFDQAYATARGQQLTVGLPDAPAGADATRSTLQLDTATRVEARLFRDRREVLLQDGQAMFSVHADMQRPFHVRAGAVRITVVGTRFSVRHTTSGLGAGQTVVSVEEGRVRVARLDPATDGAAATAPAAADAPAADLVELTAGQMVAADGQGHIGPVASIAPQAIAPWREGRISFDQIPLAQAVAEFERYGRTGLVVRDPAVAALPVGGSYSLRQFQRFADTLPQVLPVRLVPQGDGLEVVAVR